ncbi:hypothetical protein LZ31DRAFT_496 [Colletotrichum somersetense]|nr:hypothetical protein LZ31DRAFT_496 [Colletotrichum somersetense]
MRCDALQRPIGKSHLNSYFDISSSWMDQMSYHRYQAVFCRPVHFMGQLRIARSTGVERGSRRRAGT